MADSTPESLDGRVEPPEAEEAKSPRKDWRRVIGLFGESEFMREVDEECLCMREAEREAARDGKVTE